MDRINLTEYRKWTEERERGQKRKYNPPLPTESEEQRALFEWAALEEAAYPELRWLFHIPNGGYRCRVTAGKLKAEGVKPGVPDLCLPAPRGQYHGLYIELKRAARSRTTEKQVDWIAYLSAQGYAVAVCHGFEEARKALICYLGGERG